MFRRLPLALLMAAAAIACVGCDPPREALLPVFGAENVLTVVEESTTVTAQRLVGRHGQLPKSSEYETAGDPVDVPPDVASRLKRLFFDPSSYSFGIAKGCEPIFGVRLRFVRGSDIVDVLLCFECKILAVYANDAVGGGEDFDAIRDELAAILKKLFPDDATIQKL